MTTYTAPPGIERPSVITPEVHRLGMTDPLPKLDATRDHIIVLPNAPRTTGIRIIGGRTILIVGGYLSTAKGHSEPNVFIGDGAGVVYCEGLLIDGAGGGQSDGFHLQCPSREVWIRKCRVDTLNGSLATTHADVIQNLGTKRLRVQRFTGRSHYNSIYMRRENDPVGYPVGPSTFHRVNMGGYQANPLGFPDHTLRAISLGTQPIPPADPTSTVNSLLTGSVWLSEFYGTSGEAGQTLGDFVWPHAGSRMNAECRAQLAPDLLSVDWPHWASATAPPREELTPSTYGFIGSGDAQVYGVVLLGPPPGGDFVPASLVGLNYTRAA